MIGRLIAAVIVVLAVALFVWSYRTDYQGTLDRTGDVLGFQDEREQQETDTPAPGYEARGERITGP